MERKKNADFWNDICGNHAAVVNGFDISTSLGVKQFDDWYFEFYPYLKKHLFLEKIAEANVIEVGLGLGTVARYLGSRCRSYTGIDVSPRVCEFVQQTFQDFGLKGRFLNADILTDLIDEKFDYAVAIGSLHHTGNLEIALSNLESMIKLGGSSLVMVYNEFEFRRIKGRPLVSIGNYFRSVIGRQFVFVEKDESWRGLNDSNSSGEPAPYTSYQSRKFFYTKDRDCDYAVEKENFHSLIIFGNDVPRSKLLGYPFKMLGTDLYAKGIKIRP